MSYSEYIQALRPSQNNMNYSECAQVLKPQKSSRKYKDVIHLGYDSLGTDRDYENYGNNKLNADERESYNNFLRERYYTRMRF